MSQPFFKRADTKTDIISKVSDIRKIHLCFNLYVIPLVTQCSNFTNAKISLSHDAYQLIVPSNFTIIFKQ